GIERQSLRHHLVHIIILISGEPADEMHPGFGGECEILLVELTILASRDRIIGITFRAGVFVDDAGLRVLLAGQVFELSYACELVIVRIVYDRNGLILRLVQGLESELQTAVWQSPKLK